MKTWTAIGVAAMFSLGCGESRTKLISVEENLRVEKWSLSSSDFPFQGGGNWSIQKRTLHGGSQEGVDVIDVDNGTLQFRVIPTRGMSIHRVTSGDVTLGWSSPVKQIVHPKHVDLQDHGGQGWLAGFNEWMVRCGISFAGHPGKDDGLLLTLHGRVGNIPASEVEVIVDQEPPHRIRVRGLVEERMFKFGVFELWTEISTNPGSSTIRIKDTLTNKSAYEQEYQMIYHANYGQPLLEEGSTFLAPVKEIYPFDDYAAADLPTYQNYLGPTNGYGEQVYCIVPHSDNQGMSLAMLTNATGTRGVAMRYTTDTLPFLTLWKNTDTTEDGYVTGLEPGTGFPYNRVVEREAKRLRTLEPGEQVRFVVETTILSNQAAVDSTRQDITEIQQTAAPKIITTPPTPKVQGEQTDEKLVQ